MFELFFHTCLSPDRVAVIGIKVLCILFQIVRKPALLVVQGCKRYNSFEQKSRRQNGGTKHHIMVMTGIKGMLASNSHYQRANWQVNPILSRNEPQILVKPTGKYTAQSLSSQYNSLLSLVGNLHNQFLLKIPPVAQVHIKKTPGQSIVGKKAWGQAAERKKAWGQAVVRHKTWAQTDVMKKHQEDKKRRGDSAGTKRATTERSTRRRPPTSDHRVQRGRKRQMEYCDPL